MRLTVLGCGPAAPQPDTPASGLLVESGSTAILLDCGQGVAARLVRRIEPGRLSAVIIGHMHADHFIDLAGLRYRFPWGERMTPRLPVLLPPGGLARFGELAGVVSERTGFFDDAFEVREYDPAATDRIGDIDVRYVPGLHYVPAWGCRWSTPTGRGSCTSGTRDRIPTSAAAAADADLMVCEATLGSADEDDPVRRGHLTIDEAIDHGRAARARRLLITHYPSALRATMAGRVGGSDGAIVRPGPTSWSRCRPGAGATSGEAPGGPDRPAREARSRRVRDLGRRRPAA